MPPAHRWRRTLRRSAASAALLALPAAWWLAGQDGSLPWLLHRLPRWLPAGHSLQVQDAQGSVRHGGRIGWLRWSGPGMAVELHDLRWAWNLPGLLARRLDIQELHVGALHLTPAADSATAGAPPAAPQEIMLPLALHAAFDVQTLHWHGARALRIDQLRGSYTFDAVQHRLDIANVQWEHSRASATLRLTGRAPLAVQAQVRGAVQAAFSGAPQVALQAELHGALAGPDARLDAALQLHTGARDENGAMQAEIRASVHPQRAQPLGAVQARLQHLDLAAVLAAFWPQAPRTRIDGEMAAEMATEMGTPSPDAPRWRIRMQLHNRLPGPWNRQRLPLTRMDAALHHDGQRWQWQDARLQALGGHIRSSGNYRDARQFSVQAQWQGLNPFALHSQWPAHSLQGSGHVQAAAAQGLEFAAELEPQDRVFAGWLEKISLQGRWQAPLLVLDALHIDAMQARVQATDLRLDSRRAAFSGSVQASAPGVEAALDGQISAHAGQGQADIRITALPALARWLDDISTRLAPLLPADAHQPLRATADALLPHAAQARLHVDWSGGWRGVQQRLNAELHIPALRYRLPPQDAQEWLQLRDTRLTLQGTPARARIHLDAQAQHRQTGTARSARLLLAAQVGVQAEWLDWYAHIERLRADIAPDADSTWHLQMDESAPLHIEQTTQNAVRRWHATAARVQIRTAGASAPAVLAWDETEYRVERPPARQRPQWSLRGAGRIRALPLAWLDAAASGALAAIGLDGDLLLNADWNLAATRDKPQLDLVVERAAGDVRLTLPQEAGRIAAGIAQARLALHVQDDGRMTAAIDWRSAHAGRIRAELHSPLQNGAGTAPWTDWHWPPDAALRGHISASVPDIGLWSLFAPPGWRVGGSLQAQAAIGGTRGQPQWLGDLQAEGFRIVAASDGLELQDGTLRARLQGRQLYIDELRLHGAPGSGARISGPGGNVRAAAQDGGELRASGRIVWQADSAAPDAALQIDMQAQARQLQLLARADRQLSISGTMQARMQRDQLVLRGALSADRATFIAPHASAPALDADVVVRSSAASVPDKKETQPVRAMPAPDIRIALDLGDDFALQGYGITTRLRGQLQVESAAAAGEVPRISGEIRTEQGRYRAWGQSLDVESGLLRFSGDAANPALDILALRPNIAVRAGVHIQGTANAPRVRLYSEPQLPDAETLAWILAGRDPADGGAQGALLQQAALALLGGGDDGSVPLTAQIASRLGLDEIGLAGSAEGEGGAGAALSLGKRLSSNLYVTYEQSLAGAAGTLYIFYDLARNLTLRGQSGYSGSALDLVYTVRRD